MKNCINCGAPLHGDKCEYCDTEYAAKIQIPDFIADKFTGVLVFEGKKMLVNVYENIPPLDTYINSNGQLCVGRMNTKRRFTVVEQKIL